MVAIQSEIYSYRARANLAMLEFVAGKLGSLTDEFVFLGGCATALLINDSAAPDVRTTLDVDCIVDVLSLNHYRKVEKKLIGLGFNQAIGDEVICRWRYDDIILDVMPIDERILGFSNRWYKAAMKFFLTHELGAGLFIKSVTAPYFLATKLEAFKSRGNHDYLISHDFEDMVAVIDGRLNLISEIEASDVELKRYLANEFSNFLADVNFSAYLPGHLNYGPVTLARTKMVLDRIRQIADMAGG